VPPPIPPVPVCRQHQRRHICSAGCNYAATAACGDGRVWRPGRAAAAAAGCNCAATAAGLQLCRHCRLWRRARLAPGRAATAAQGASVGHGGMSGRSVRQGLEAVGTRRSQRDGQAEAENIEAHRQCREAFMIRLLKCQARVSSMRAGSGGMKEAAFAKHGARQ